MVNATLSVSPEPSPYEANIDIFLVVVVPSGALAPGGTVLFSIDGVPIGPPRPVQYSIAEEPVNTPTYGVGTHTVTAAYSGDANYDPVIVSVPHVVIKLRSSTSLTLRTNTFYYGQQLLIDTTAMVTPTDTAPDATLNGGTLDFLVDGTSICQLTLTGLRQSCPANAGQEVNSGSHVFRAVYSGNQYYEGSQSTDGNFTVLPDDTKMTLGTSLTPSVFGQPVTFSAKVTATYATPVGPVDFFDGATLLGVGNLDATGTATLTVSTLALGAHSIAAKYPATRNFNESSATPITQVVVPPSTTPVGTATLVTSSVNPSMLGQSVTFTATVATVGSPVQIASGNVTFLDGATPLATAALDATGSAQFTTSTLALGQHKITVNYAGTATLAASASATLLQTVVTSQTTSGNGFLLTVTPTTFGVGVGNYVSVSVNVLPLNGFNEPVTLNCLSAPAEMRCLFDQVTVPAGGGTTRLTVNPAAPHDCGSDAPYFISADKAGLFLPLFTGLGILFARRRRKSAIKYLALMGVLALLPMLGGCGHCTDLGVRPGNYTFSVQGSSTGSAAITHSVAMKMNVHL